MPEGTGGGPGPAVVSVPVRAHRRRANVARFPVIATVAAALVVGLLAGTRGRAPAAPEPTTPNGPVAAPAGALASTFYCAGASDVIAHAPRAKPATQPKAKPAAQPKAKSATQPKAKPATQPKAKSASKRQAANRPANKKPSHTTAAPAVVNLAAGKVLVTNAGTAPLGVTVELVPSVGPDRRVSLTVPSRGRVAVPEQVPGGAPWIGAVVDLGGGDATVEQLDDGPLGEADEPCASSGSTHWYFASGATLVNATSVISLLNPYPSPAIVDLSFTTNQGVEQPGAFQGLVVPAEGLVAVNLQTHLRRRSQIATSVAVQAGRVVAWKTDLVTAPKKGTPLLGTKAASAPDADPAAPVPGVTLTLGAEAPATTWTWPEGLTAPGAQDEYIVYNPGQRTAMVALTLRFGRGLSEPFDLTVGPEEVTSVATGQQARIPSGTGYSAVLRSTNGVGVVAERVDSFGPPSGMLGTAEMLGAVDPATAWLLGQSFVSKTGDEVVAVSNPGSRPVRVTFSAIGARGGSAVAGVPAFTLAGGDRKTVDLGRADPTFNAGLLVRGSGPIVVARTLYGTHGTPGVSLSLGLPLSP